MSIPTVIRFARAFKPVGDARGGHGASTPMSMVIAQSTDVWSFMMDQLGMEPVFGE